MMFAEALLCGCKVFDSFGSLIWTVISLLLHLLIGGAANVPVILVVTEGGRSVVLAAILDHSWAPLALAAASWIGRAWLLLYLMSSVLVLVAVTVSSMRSSVESSF
jgi:hypothetical protein